MRLIPEEPEFSDGQLAEKVLWRTLKESLPDDAVLAHSVQLRDGRAEHEIDLLILWPGVGLAAIEVKGGLVSVENGQWYQSDRSGLRKIQSPVAQSQGSMHAFKNWIASQTGTLLSSRFTYMVALPYTSVPEKWSMAGCPRTLVLDQAGCKSPAELVRSAIEREGGGASSLASSFVDRMVRHLSGTLPPSPSGNHQNPRELEDSQDYLTEKQSVLLKATRSLKRIEFTGGAGSGKTWLAVEKAKLLCMEGKRVGLFCPSKGLGQHLQDQVSQWRQARPAFTGELHEYARLLGIPGGSGQAYFDEDMPRLLTETAAGLPAHEKLDAVVVDEAQDFAPLWWEALLACTKDPASSEVYSFRDDHQAVYRRRTGTSAALAHPMPGLVPIHIDDNLRNTRRIADTFKSFAGEHFTPRGSTGLPVRLVQCKTDDALDVADSCVDALIEEGWSNNQIALLTTNGRHPIHRDFFDRDAIPEYWREFHANEAEFYGHVLGFKGLERSVVVLCVNGFKELDRAAEQLYVGLSRARSLLTVVGDAELLEQVGGRDLRLALSRAEAWRPTT